MEFLVKSLSFDNYEYQNLMILQGTLARLFHLSGKFIYMESLVSNPREGLWCVQRMKKVRDMAALGGSKKKDTDHKARLGGEPRNTVLKARGCTRQISDLI